MSENNCQQEQAGPGPPYAYQMIPSYMHDASISRQQGPATGSTASSLSGGHPQGLGTSTSDRSVGTIGQGLRMGQPGVGFVPADFQSVCGSSSPRPSMGATLGASAYYPYPAVASMYPYGVVGQGSAGTSPGLDADRLSAMNRAVTLARTPTPATQSSSMESAWGAQYSHPATWPAVSSQVARRSPSFHTVPAPSATCGVAGPVTTMTTATSAPIASTSPSSAETVDPVPAKTVSNAKALLQSNGNPELQHKNMSRGSGPAAGDDEALGGGSVASNRPESPDEEVVDASRAPSPKKPGERDPMPVVIESDANGQKKQPAEAEAMTRAEIVSSGKDDENQGDHETESMGKRRHLLTAEERLQRSRERNQIHARKTRQRKKAQLQLLMNRSADLQAEQHRLRQAITDRRTASILLGMSGSEDVNLDDQEDTTASHEHDPALATMSQDMPRGAMLAALESDDTAEIGGKGNGGNGSDDLSSETTAGTSCSMSSSGRTSSEANSSDGAIGGTEGDVAEKPRVGNPGDTERLLELSQKTRSECTPEELEEIRRERNRMHAKRTRDRKKLHLEATEGMIARLEQENRKLRESMKAMGSGLNMDQAPTRPSTQSSASPAPDIRMPGFPQSTQTLPQSPASQTTGGAQVHPAPPPSQASTQQYPGHNPFLHQGPNMPHLHGHAHAHLYAAQHHLSHGAHHLMHSPVQPPGPPHHLGYYSHRFGQPGRNNGVNGIVGSNGGGGGPTAGGAGTGVARSGAGLVKPDMSSYSQGGRMASLGFMGHSSTPYPLHPQVLAYHGSSAFAPLGKSHMMSALPHGPHAYPGVPESRAYKVWDAHGHAPPGSGYLGAWAGGAYGAEAPLGAIPAAAQVQQEEFPAKMAALGREKEGGAVSGGRESKRRSPVSINGLSRGNSSSQATSSNGDGSCGEGGDLHGVRKNDAVDARIPSARYNGMRDNGSNTCSNGSGGGGRSGGGGEGNRGGSSCSDGAGGDRTRGKGPNGASGGGGSKAKAGKEGAGAVSSSSSSSPTGNGSARHVARARGDKAGTGKSRATATKTREGEREGEEQEQEQQGGDPERHMLDRDFARNCSDSTWQNNRRYRSAKRKRGASSSSGSGSSRSNCPSSPSPSRVSRGSMDSGSERDGSGGEGSESSSSSSSWLGGSESSVLPASTTSSDGGRGRESMTRSGSESPRDSPSMSESGSEEMGSGDDEYNGRVRGVRGGNDPGGNSPSTEKNRRRLSAPAAAMVQLSRYL